MRNRLVHTGILTQLEETARLSVENVAGIIDLLPAAGATVSIAPQERQAWAKIAAWHTPFPVASICREDLRHILSDEEIRRLDDSDMEAIANRMSDAYRDSGGYWESLEIMARYVLGKRAADETPAHNAQPTVASPTSEVPPPTAAKALDTYSDSP